jgi:hypothetical protein
MFRSLFRGARPPAPAPARRRSFVPRLDVLEDRSVPATLIVTNLGDTGVPGDGSLRGEIGAAAPGDVVTFAATLSGTINLGSDLGIGSDLTVQGNLDAAGHPLVSLSRGESGSSTDLFVGAGVTASVYGLGFTGANGHAVVNNGTLTLDHITVSGNWLSTDPGSATNSFGTVYNTATLTVQDSTISNNHTGYPRAPDTYGGAGILNSGTLTVLRTQLADNVAEGGNAYGPLISGGGCISNTGTATITDCTLTGNQALFGAAVDSIGALTVTGCTISGNTAYSSGGGGGLDVSGTAQVTDCTVTGNTAASGGGIEVDRATVTVSGCTISGNSASQGGGLYVSRRALTVNVTNCSIANNTAGGGMYIATLGLPTSPVVNVVACTVTGNQTGGAGGGLRVGPGAKVTLESALVAGNTATTAPDVSGALLTASSYNLVGNGDGSSGLADGTNGNQVGTTASPIDPKLGPLQYNGGLTPTMALLAGSPALDAADPTLAGGTDQRGGDYVRVYNGRADIGAFEVQPDPHPRPSVSIGNASVVEGNVGTASMLFTVTLSAPSPDVVSVDYATADGTATAGSDYAAAAGTLTFLPGETSKTIAVTVLSDRIAEPNETLTANLSNPQMATVAGGAGVGTILDDEPRISIGDVSKPEGRTGSKTQFVFTVTLSAAYDQPVTVSFTTTDGTAAAADRDYVASTGTLTFNPGETTKTITIVVNGDGKREANETFFVDLFGNSTNSLFTRNRGIGTILNDD